MMGVITNLVVVCAMLFAPVYAADAGKDAKSTTVASKKKPTQKTIKKAVKKKPSKKSSKKSVKKATKKPAKKKQVMKRAKKTVKKPVKKSTKKGAKKKTTKKIGKKPGKKPSKKPVSTKIISNELHHIMINGTPVTLVHDDITQQFQKDSLQAKQTAAIVNAANTTLIGSAGIARAIQKAAGPGLITELTNKKFIRKNVRCDVGDACLSGGHKLAPVRIIHAVGPMGEDPNMLRTTYMNILKTAQTNGITRVAIPAISTGIFGYSVDKATPVAIAAIRQYLTTNKPNAFAEVRLVIWDSDAKKLQDMKTAYQNAMK